MRVPPDTAAAMEANLRRHRRSLIVMGFLTVWLASVVLIAGVVLALVLLFKGYPATFLGLIPCVAWAMALGWTQRASYTRGWQLGSVEMALLALPYVPVDSPRAAEFRLLAAAALSERLNYEQRAERSQVLAALARAHHGPQD